MSVYNTFSEYLYEIENYGTRYERLMEEWDNGMTVERMMEWLNAAYNAGNGAQLTNQFNVTSMDEFKKARLSRRRAENDE